MSCRMLVARPIKRQGFWYLVRRVPKRLSGIDRRRMVVKSTGIRICDDPRGVVANIMVAELDRCLAQYWLDVKNGGDGFVKCRGSSVEDAKWLGLSDVPTVDLRSFGHVDSFLGTKDRWRGSEGPAKSHTTTGPMVSQMLTQFTEIQKVPLQRKSKNQYFKWQVERRTALRRFLRSIGGDKPIAQLSP